MATPIRPAQHTRSAAIPAVLSFVFPGLGQALSGARQTALVFALPVLAVIALAAFQFRDGIARGAPRLLDPAIARAVFLLAVLLGVWRVAAVLHAARVGRSSEASRLVVAALAAVIGLSHLYVGVSALEVGNAGTRIFSGDPLGDLGDRPAVVSWLEPGASPAAGRLPGEQVSDPDDDEPVGEPEPEIEPGPLPGVDIADLEGLDDGLLNVLIVGIDWKDGRDHALTDTMIVVSVHADSGEVLMFGFPRDIASFALYDGGTYTGRLNGFANYAHHHPSATRRGPCAHSPTRSDSCSEYRSTTTPA